jgi:hypothetical protein
MGGVVRAFWHWIGIGIAWRFWYVKIDGQGSHLAFCRRYLRYRKTSDDSTSHYFAFVFSAVLQRVSLSIQSQS